MKNKWLRRALYFIFAVASVIIIAGAVKSGIDKHKTNDPAPEPETAQVQVVDLVA